VICHTALTAVDESNWVGWQESRLITPLMFKNYPRFLKKLNR